MIPFEEIDRRLESIGKDRKWLSEASGRKPDSIRVALAPNAPAAKRSELLQKALSDAITREEERRHLPIVSAPSLHLPDRITIECAPEERRSWQQAASAKNKGDLDAWVLDSLNQAAKAWHKEIETVVSFQPKPNVLAAAGSPISAEVTDWDGADNTVMVKISGLSMVPLLNDGDVIPMKHKRASRNPFMKKGLIYLVEYESGYTVKRYNTRPATPEEKGEEWAEKGKVKVLESINKDYPEIVIKQPIEWIAWLDKSDKI